MSDYKRITMREFAGVTGDNIYNRLAELEDKIEAGTLVDRDEYKHRAEVAEKALRKAVSVLDAEYRAFGVNKENKTEQRIKKFIEQAEKELSEVKNEV